VANKYFTPAEANQLLPLVQAELATLQQQKADFYHKVQQLQQLNKRISFDPADDSLEDERFRLECELDFMEMEARLRLRHLAEQGIQIKDIDIGLVDFPAIIDGEEVLLCWKQGEPAITHYHGLHDGFTGRKPIN